MNQCSVILNHLMKHSGISTKEAREKYQILSLSARIKELRDLGLRIILEDGQYALVKTERTKVTERVIEEDDLFPDFEW